MATDTRTTLVLLAAGMGSRYGGVKQIDGVGPNGEAIIDYSIYDALRVGFTDLCFVVRADIEDAVREFFAGKFPDTIRVTYAIQSLDDIPGGTPAPAGREKPWGTSHAVYAARHVVESPFAVINADDFYGRDAYKTLHAYLAALSNSETDYAMVGYRLEETLSPHGTVSRGICRKDADGFLESITEHKKIAQTDGRITDTGEDGSTEELQPDDVASMNMFGFTPAVFAQIEGEFAAFVRRSGSDPRAEFYIPDLMTRLIAAGEAQMRVLSTTARWFGMTYREDRDMVQERIREYVEAGIYPKNLWG
jgi:UTP-glucose-1-phosphate uridylyltransferase